MAEELRRLRESLHQEERPTTTPTTRRPWAAAIVTALLLASVALVVSRQTRPRREPVNDDPLFQPF